MDIEGLGEQRVQLFVDQGLLNDVADLYSFTTETFDGLEGFAALSIANLLAAIDESRSRPLHRVLIGLGIRHLGQVGSVALARALGDVDADHVGRRGQPGRGGRCGPGDRRQRGPVVRLRRPTGRWSSGSGRQG